MKQARLAFLGCGNMGRSLIGGLIANGYPENLIVGADPSPEQRQLTGRLFNIDLFESSESAVADADVIVLAVKPQVLLETAREISPGFKAESTLVLSVAAGVQLSAINAALGGGAAIVRVMPNTPALIQAGAAGLFANERVSDDQKELAEAIMRSVGVTVWLRDEESIDTVTALSGSGPAYFFLQMEAMEKAAIKLGLEPENARLLTLETALGAAKMALESDFDPAELRRQVTSPGGTTEKALQVLTDGGYLELFENALRGARDRSQELAETFSDGDHS